MVTLKFLLTVAFGVALMGMVILLWTLCASIALGIGGVAAATWSLIKAARRWRWRR